MRSLLLIVSSGLLLQLGERNDSLSAITRDRLEFPTDCLADRLGDLQVKVQRQS